MTAGTTNGETEKTMPGTTSAKVFESSHLHGLQGIKGMFQIAGMVIRFTTINTKNDQRVAMKNIELVFRWVC